VAFVLTSVTISCFALALLYDIQYPADDGSCSGHHDMMSCISRKTVLDSSRSYCRWLGESHQLSPGVIEESRGGQVMQVITLETVLLTNGEDAVDCVYDDSDVSGFVMLAVLLMTMIVKVPLDFALVIIFMVLMAKPHVELEHRKVVNEIVKKRWSSLQSQESFCQGNVTKSSERRRGDFVMNTERSGYGIGMPKNTQSVVWRSLYVSKIPALLTSGCGKAWYDIYKVYMKLDPHSAIVPEKVH
jgi:hypothetical protein